MSKQTAFYAAGIQLQTTSFRAGRFCTAGALLLLQGCAASSYYPVAYSRPVAVQAYPPPVVVTQAAPVVTVSQPAPVAVPAYSSEQIDRLMGPIALYPDPLLAQLLPASTYPLDIVRAAQLVRSSPTEEQISAQDWDASVKAIAHYPTVLEYMDKNLDWTQQLGQAFITQPEEVMQSVQRLRLQASTLGNLVTTPQQQVVVEDQITTTSQSVQYIRIVPVATEFIYVPVYQPEVVYYQPASFVTFGIGCHIGSWLDMDCDWRSRSICRPGWTWNHWDRHYHVDHHRISYRGHNGDRHDNFDDRDRRSNQWQRDSRRPMGVPDRDTRRSLWNGASNGFGSNRGPQSLREPRQIGQVDPDGRPEIPSRTNWPSQRETNPDSFRGAPTADQPPVRPNVPAPSPEIGRPNVPSARPIAPTRPTVSPPTRTDIAAQPPMRPSVPQTTRPSTPAAARPNVQAPVTPATRPAVPSARPAPAAPARPPVQAPAVQAPAPSRPSTPVPSRAPSQPSPQTPAPAPSRPANPPPSRPAPVQQAPRVEQPAPSRPATPAPSRPSTPAPSQPAAQPAPSRPPTPAPAAAPRPSQPAPSPSAPPSRPDVPKNPR